MKMNWCLAPIIVFSSLVYAQSPSDFRSAASVTPAAGDALQRLTLPFEVYRDTRPDLADIRIFNSSAEAMPMAWAGTPEPEVAAPATTRLPMFSLFESPDRRADDSLAARVDISVNGAVISVRGAKPPATKREARPVAWLLDASQLKTPIRKVVIDWNSGAGNEAVRVTVEASDDLKSWRTVASRAPILRVQQDGRELAQRKVDLRNTSAKYLRVTVDPAVVVRTVDAEAAPTSRAIAREMKTVPGTLSAKPGEYVFDLGARLPVEALRLKLAAANSVAPVTLLARDDPSKEPRGVTNATFYWLVRSGVDIESPLVEIGRQPARYWVARLDPASPPPGGGPPSLEVEWRPAQMIFVARGDAPFALAFGNPEAKPAVLQVSLLFPGYERGAELKLAEAKVGAVTTGEMAGDLLRKMTGGASPRRIALWAILIVAVIAMGWMAYALARQVKPPG